MLLIVAFSLETHLYSPNLFNELMESEMSEMDYILYFWGPIVKSLFINTDIWSHWGDTQSRDCMYKFRLDLRLLSSKLKKSYDVASGEFGQALTESKYYSDKQKLILNGLIQIDNILHTYKGNESDVKLPLFQALGFHADIYFLYRKSSKVYVVDRIGTVDFPTVKKDLVQKSIVLVDEFLKFKNMAVELQDIVLESNSNTKKTVTNITSAESSSASKLPKRFVWQEP
ncbi:hypothetical protein BD770DRAFT_162080 [Pilaira anomala]|nr:hypothetical protein BD770DRAFT_162080 [Pilaira anomala]